MLLKTTLASQPPIPELFSVLDQDFPSVGKTPELAEGHERALSVISYIGCSLSILALVVTLVTIFGYK